MSIMKRKNINYSLLCLSIFLRFIFKIFRGGGSKMKKNISRIFSIYKDLKLYLIVSSPCSTDCQPKDLMIESGNYSRENRFPSFLSFSGHKTLTRDAKNATLSILAVYVQNWPLCKTTVSSRRNWVIHFAGTRSACSRISYIRERRALSCSCSMPGTRATR